MNDEEGRAGRRGMQNATALALFLAGLLLMLGLQAWGRPFAARGIYFQHHSSESMMQTVSLLDLRGSPWETLLYLHIQPPLLDGLRGLLTQFWPDLGNRDLMIAVDRGLYLVWMMLYASMGVLIFRWLEQLMESVPLAALAALLFLLHPAAIFYATLLEGTFLTSFAVLWLSYALWAIPARGAILSLGGAYLLLFLVRSIFQWPALVVLAVALLLLRVPRRTVLVFAAVCGLVVGAFMLKQYALFGSTSTSSFAGSSCLQSLGESPEMGFSSVMTIPMGPLFPHVDFRGYPSVLTRAKKITPAHNFNHIADLYNERRLLRRCLQKLASDPVSSTLRAYLVNGSIFLQPSSRYVTSHAIVDRLPWRGVYDWVFSGYRLVLLLAASSLWWFHRASPAARLRGLGLALPILYVASVCVVFERAENMRYKFFVEPVLFVFLVAQVSSAYRALRPGAGGGG